MSEKLLSQAEVVGLDVASATDILAKYGEVVLSLIISLIQGGLSKEWVLSALQKLGPALLEIITELLANPTVAVAAGEATILEGERVEDFGPPKAGLLDIVRLLVQYAPMIIEYLPQLIEIIKVIGPILDQLKKSK